MVARALIQIWMSRFGVPSTITTDRGGQFESHLWKTFTDLLGTKHTRTTAYHPIANGMVERFHLQLKSSLKASPHHERWTDMLHLALLGIRTTLKEDLKCTAAELVYDTSLRLPGEFFTPQAIANADPASYVTQLKDTMRALRCTPTRRPLHSSRHPDNSLRSATHVFVRHDAVRKPPYNGNGPYRVLDRSDHSYTSDLNGPTDSVSIDRLKPAHIDFPIAPETHTTSSSTSPTTSQPTPSDPVREPSATRTTRSGQRALASPSQGFRSIAARWRGSDVVSGL